MYLINLFSPSVHRWRCTWTTTKHIHEWCRSITTRQPSKPKVCIPVTIWTGVAQILPFWVQYEENWTVMVMSHSLMPSQANKLDITVASRWRRVLSCWSLVAGGGALNEAEAWTGAWRWRGPDNLLGARWSVRLRWPARCSATSGQRGRARYSGSGGMGVKAETDCGLRCLMGPSLNWAENHGP
jgi:hypothetical protein